jgi:2-polyprenyl-3-methyl-5-hydroxy-6-metoxy-1,4-benzoquinol methylase
MTSPHSLLRPALHCRLCAAPFAGTLANFPPLPVAGTYASPADTAPEPLFPLTLVRCAHCGLVQLRESLAPSFYSQYRFLSGVAGAYRDHLTALAGGLAGAGNVLEIGASDGTLLGLLAERGCRVAGFEPAREPSSRARQKGVPVLNEIFGRDTARQCPLPSVDVVVIRHVLEHIDDFASIFEGLATLAGPGTKLVVEVPDLRSTVDAAIYGNIYHIHPCYFDVASMSRLLARYGWVSEGARIVDVFGGSLLLWAGREGNAEPDRAAFPGVRGTPPGPVEPAQLAAFVDGWRDAAATSRGFFDELRATGATVAGYGAAERTTALLGTAGIDASHLQALYDRNPALEGLATPGSRIPIRHPRRILDDMPDYLVIFARSFEEEIVRELAAYRAAGGRIVTTRTAPPRILESAA